MAAAGLGDGAYRLGTRDVEVEGMTARLADGTFAGSVLTMDAAVRNLVTLGASEVQALLAATRAPARLLARPDLGVLAPGVPADIVVLDDGLEVRATSSRATSSTTSSRCAAALAPRLLQDAAEAPQVRVHRAPHRPRHHRGGDLGEAGRLAAVAQRHPRRALGRVVPGVGGLHRERPLRGAHHEALAGHELADLVGVGEPPPEEGRDEREARADGERPWRLPLDRLDVRVPRGRVVGVGGVGGDLGARPRDLGLADDVDGHRG